MPAHPVTLRTEGSASAAVVFVPPGDSASPAAADFRGGRELDIFAAAAPGDTILSNEPAWSRTEVMVLDRQLRFVDGTPRYAYTVNGSAYPNIKPLVVDEGEVVKVTVANRTSEPHPMHPHGHHVLVLSRNGQAPAASPLWLDTFDVLPGEVWEVLLTADNPGIWMDHCHNLDHAAQGMMMHLQYRGYSSPFVHGGSSGNRSE
jgi:FtsP/CotA-like multicopper oxidase with cupredoxin domain